MRLFTFESTAIDIGDHNFSARDYRATLVADRAYNNRSIFLSR
jgi:hypothetical protein